MSQVSPAAAGVSPSVTIPQVYHVSHLHLPRGSASFSKNKDNSNPHPTGHLLQGQLPPSSNRALFSKGNSPHMHADLALLTLTLQRQIPVSRTKDRPGRQRTWRPDSPADPHSGVTTGKSRRRQGLPSADRNNKATLLLTGPFRTTKSSAKDSIPRVSKLQYASHRRALRARRHARLLGYEAEAYSYTSTTCGRYRRFLAWILT